MAIGTCFRPASMNADRDNETIRRLEPAGAGSPPGRSYHVCFGAGDQLQVFDVRDSQAAFERFAETLMPILQELQLDPGQPMVEPVHNVITE